MPVVTKRPNYQTLNWYFEDIVWWQALITVHKSSKQHESATPKRAGVFK